MRHVRSIWVEASNFHGVQIPLVVRVAMPVYQSFIYTWVQETGTIRLDPLGPHRGAAHIAAGIAPLNNKCMELRKVCSSSC